MSDRMKTALAAMPTALATTPTVIATTPIATAGRRAGRRMASGAA